MKNSKSELYQFVTGFAMLVAGLFLFLQKVIVYSSIFSEYLFFVRLEFQSVMVPIPLLIGLVWIYRSRASTLSKIFTILGVIIIVASVLLASYITFMHISAFEWITLLLLIFIGAALLSNVLLKVTKDKQMQDLKEKESIWLQTIE